MGPLPRRRSKKKQSTVAVVVILIVLALFVLARTNRSYPGPELDQVWDGNCEFLSVL